MVNEWCKKTDGLSNRTNERAMIWTQCFTRPFQEVLDHCAVCSVFFESMNTRLSKLIADRFVTEHDDLNDVCW